MPDKLRGYHTPSMPHVPLVCAADLCKGLGHAVHQPEPRAAVRGQTNDPLRVPVLLIVRAWQHGRADSTGAVAAARHRDTTAEPHVQKKDCGCGWCDCVVRGQYGIAQHSTQTPRLEEEKNTCKQGLWNTWCTMVVRDQRDGMQHGTAHRCLAPRHCTWSGTKKSEAKGWGGGHSMKNASTTQRGGPIHNPTTQNPHAPTPYTAHPNTAPMTHNPIPSRTEAAAASPPPYTLHHSPYTHRNSQMHANNLHPAPQQHPPQSARAAPSESARCS